MKKKTIQDRIKEKEIETNIKKKYNIDNKEKIVIEKKNTLFQFILFIQSFLSKILKLLFYIAVTILSTIGLTMILNPDNSIIQIFEIIKNNIHFI